MAGGNSIGPGYVLVDKPDGPSSHSAVQQVRRALGIGGRRGTRAGHAGTLDPFATGLLVVLIGRATRLMPHVVGHDKHYLLDVAFGASSDTDDRVGNLTPTRAARPTRDAVELAIAELARTVEQVPPAVSAIHIDGERAYRRVRRGETVVVPARPVRFDHLELVGWDEQASIARIDVRCSTGTYMRSLARDLGELVECAAHASDLRRLEVGHWIVDGARIPGEVRPDDVLPALDLVPGLPRRVLGAAELVDVRHGRRVPAELEDVAEGREVALIDPLGTLAAIAVVTAAAMLQPRTVLGDVAGPPLAEHGGGVMPVSSEGATG